MATTTSVRSTNYVSQLAKSTSNKANTIESALDGFVKAERGTRTNIIEELCNNHKPKISMFILAILIGKYLDNTGKEIPNNLIIMISKAPEEISNAFDDATKNPDRKVTVTGSGGILSSNTYDIKALLDSMNKQVETQQSTNDINYGFETKGNDDSPNIMYKSNNALNSQKKHVMELMKYLAKPKNLNKPNKVVELFTVITDSLTQDLTTGNVNTALLELFILSHELIRRDASNSKTALDTLANLLSQFINSTNEITKNTITSKNVKAFTQAINTEALKLSKRTTQNSKSYRGHGFSKNKYDPAVFIELCTKQVGEYAKKQRPALINNLIHIMNSSGPESESFNNVLSYAKNKDGSFDQDELVTLITEIHKLNIEDNNKTNLSNKIANKITDKDKSTELANSRINLYETKDEFPENSIINQGTETINYGPEEKKDDNNDNFNNLLNTNKEESEQKTDNLGRTSNDSSSHVTSKEKVNLNNEDEKNEAEIEQKPNTEDNKTDHTDFEKKVENGDDYLMEYQTILNNNPTSTNILIFLEKHKDTVRTDTFSQQELNTFITTANDTNKGQTHITLIGLLLKLHAIRDLECSYDDIYKKHEDILKLSLFKCNIILSIYSLCKTASIAPSKIFNLLNNHSKTLEKVLIGLDDNVAKSLRNSFPKLLDENEIRKLPVEYRHYEYFTNQDYLILNKFFTPLDSCTLDNLLMSTGWRLKGVEISEGATVNDIRYHYKNQELMQKIKNELSNLISNKNSEIDTFWFEFIMPEINDLLEKKYTINFMVTMCSDLLSIIFKTYHTTKNEALKFALTPLLTQIADYTQALNETNKLAKNEPDYDKIYSEFEYSIAEMQAQLFMLNDSASEVIIISPPQNDSAIKALDFFKPQIDTTDMDYKHATVTTSINQIKTAVDNENWNTVRNFFLTDIQRVFIDLSEQRHFEVLCIIKIMQYQHIEINPVTIKRFVNEKLGLNFKNNVYFSHFFSTVSIILNTTLPKRTIKSTVTTVMNQDTFIWTLNQFNKIFGINKTAGNQNLDLESKTETNPKGNNQSFEINSKVNEEKLTNNTPVTLTDDNEQKVTIEQRERFKKVNINLMKPDNNTVVDNNQLQHLKTVEQSERGNDADNSKFNELSNKIDQSKDVILNLANKTNELFPFNISEEKSEQNAGSETFNQFANKVCNEIDNPTLCRLAIDIVKSSIEGIINQEQALDLLNQILDKMTSQYRNLENEVKELLNNEWTSQVDIILSQKESIEKYEILEKQIQQILQEFNKLSEISLAQSNHNESKLTNFHNQFKKNIKNFTYLITCRFNSINNEISEVSKAEKKINEYWQQFQDLNLGNLMSDTDYHKIGKSLGNGSDIVYYMAKNINIYKQELKWFNIIAPIPEELYNDNDELRTIVEHAHAIKKAETEYMNHAVTIVKAMKQLIIEKSENVRNAGNNIIKKVNKGENLTTEDTEILKGYIENAKGLQQYQFLFPIQPEFFFTNKDPKWISSIILEYPDRGEDFKILHQCIIANRNFIEQATFYILNNRINALQQSGENIQTLVIEIATATITDETKKKFLLTLILNKENESFTLISLACSIADSDKITDEQLKQDLFNMVCDKISLYELPVLQERINTSNKVFQNLIIKRQQKLSGEKIPTSQSFTIKHDEEKVEQVEQQPISQLGNTDTKPKLTVEEKPFEINASVVEEKPTNSEYNLVVKV